MKVLLYYPLITPQNDVSTHEPLQLIFLGRMLRQASIDYEIIDARLFNDETKTLEYIKSRIEDNDLCLAITALTCYQVIDGLNIAKHIKIYKPTLPIIFGGWHVSTFPEETLNEDGIDIVVIGQGEITFLELCEAFIKKDPLGNIKGIFWKNNNAIIKNTPREFISPNELPGLKAADFEILELTHYQLNNVLFYMSSVGCPYQCTYCSIISVYNRKWLALSADKILEEITGLKKRFEFKEIIFWDNVFFSDKNRIIRLCQELVDIRLGISWSAHARINEIAKWDNEFLKLIKSSGCKSVFIGIETASQRILDRIKKGIKAEDIIPCLKKLREFDINVAINFMVDFPQESFDDIRQTIKCIENGLRIYDDDIERFDIHIYMFVPIPGTLIYKELEEDVQDDLPRTAKEWVHFVHEKIDNAMEPWKEDDTPSHFAQATFYLWKAYLQRDNSKNFKRRLLKTISKARISTGFLRLPIEWYLWKLARKLKSLY